MSSTPGGFGARMPSDPQIRGTQEGGAGGTCPPIFSRPQAPWWTIKMENLGGKSFNKGKFVLKVWVGTFGGEEFLGINKMMSNQNK